MKLAFSGEARYPDYRDGYELYTRRARVKECVDMKTYKAVVNEYCKALSERLLKDGMADLPASLGTVSAVTMQRKPRYKKDRTLGFGKMNWTKGHYDGSFIAFGLSFLPNRNRNNNLRCYGFVANRKLFKKMKDMYESYDCPWVPIELKDEMI